MRLKFSLLFSILFTLSSFDTSLIREPFELLNLEDINGEKVNINDFEGKVVYLDVWATWCLPCRVLYPKSQKLAEEYEGKDIVFLYVSVDHEQEKWRKFIKRKKPHGINLIADENFLNSFMIKYNIIGIPRFMLIDKKGNLVDQDAARPGWPELTEQIDNLLKE